jgi:nucleoid DNA-binding protein
MAKNKAAGKSITKSEALQRLAAKTNLTRKQVSSVVEAMAELIKKEVGKGPGIFNVFGLFKIKRVHKPATKGGQRPNPFKPGEMMDVKAKPARNVVRVRPLKALNEMVK